MKQIYVVLQWDYTGDCDLLGAFEDPRVAQEFADGKKDVQISDEAGLHDILYIERSSWI